MKNEKDKIEIFTQDQIADFAGFYNTLKKIHTRLMAEGYVFESGRLVPPKTQKQENVL